MDNDTIDLEDALGTMVNGQRLGELPVTALRILKLWCRNKLTTVPDDAQLLRLQDKIERVMTFRRISPLPRPVSVPAFDGLEDL